MTPPTAYFSTLKFQDDLHEKLRLRNYKPISSVITWHMPNTYRTAEQCHQGCMGPCRGIGYKRWGTDIVTCNRCFNTWRKVAETILEDKRQRSIGRNDYDPDDYLLSKIMGGKKELITFDETF